MAFTQINLAQGGDTSNQAFTKVNNGFADTIRELVMYASVDWDAAYTWNSGKLQQIVWALGDERVKAVYTYTGDLVTGIAYSYSTNAGSDYTPMGTNTLAYTGTELDSETWS